MNLKTPNIVLILALFLSWSQIVSADQNFDIRLPASMRSEQGSVAACMVKNSLIPKGKIRLEKGLQSLPKQIFIAKEATYLVDGEAFRLKSQQAFKKPASRLLCASSLVSQNLSFSIYAPTLIDLTLQQEIGDAFWQFQMTANEKDFAIWNRQSKLLNLKGSIQDKIQRLGMTAQVFQLSHDEFQVIYAKKTGAYTESLAVTYDMTLALK